MAMAQKKRIPLEERRGAVLDAARKVFMESGFGGASMREIAAEAGVNEAMLYRIAPSKQELFEEAVAGPLEAAVSRTAEKSAITAQRRPGPKEMRELTRGYVKDMLDAMHQIAPLLNAVLLTDRDTAMEFYGKRVEPSVERIVEVVKNNLGHWPHREFDPDFLIRSLLGICWYAAVDRRFRRGKHLDTERQADEIVQLIFDGLLLRDP